MFSRPTINLREIILRVKQLGGRFSGTKKVIVGVVVLCCVTIGSLRLFPQYLPLAVLSRDPFLSKETRSALLRKRQEHDVVSAVGKLIELPSTPPVVATITDVRKLFEQPFFAAAEDGDKVLFYADAKMVLLYRPSTNKLIKVATLSLTPSMQEKNKTFLDSL